MEFESIRRQIAAIPGARGMDAEPVSITAEVMLEADLAAIDSHGASMLMMYEDSRNAGRLKLRAQPAIVRETPVTALIGAGAGLGHPAGVAGMRLAIKKAQAMCRGAVSVFNSHLFDAAGYYAALASSAGLLCERCSVPFLLEPATR